MKKAFVLFAMGLLGVASVRAQDAPPAPGGLARFGCQARTFGEGVYKDEATFLGVVRQIGEVGFAGLETNSKNLERYFDRPADFAKILHEAHLRLIAAHMGGSPWAAGPRAKLLGDVERAARFVNQVGGQYVVFSGSLPKARPLPADTWMKMAEFVNDVGRACRSGGVRCLYHNHWADCEGGGLEQLAKATDPQLVGFALDTGHALRAGQDPAALIGVLGRRLGLVHFADYTDEGPAGPRRPPLGEGRLNIPAVVAALHKAGGDPWIVLEEETASGGGRSLAERGLARFRAAFSPGK